MIVPRLVTVALPILLVPLSGASCQSSHLMYGLKQSLMIEPSITGVGGVLAAYRLPTWGYWVVYYGLTVSFKMVVKKRNRQ